MTQNVTVVIRAAGERTEALCRLLVEQQVPESNVFLIHEKPFSRAVATTFRIGQAQGKDWTLAVDADVLINENAIANLVNNATALEKQIKDKLYVYQGHILCKVFGKPRTAGLHLYQTKYLAQAASLIPTDPHARWPESTTYRAMNDLGLYHYVETGIYALHDYEQYHRDMFRNGYFQSKKHFHYIADLLPYWKKQAAIDLAFEVMLHGWVLGMMDKEKLQVDQDFFDRILKPAFPKLNIAERAAIDLSELPSYQQKIRLAIEQFADYPLQSKLSPRPKPLPTLSRRVKNKLGYTFIRIGNKIKSS